MKLFIREHRSLIVMQLMQWSFIGMLLLLSGYRNVSIMLYGLIVSVFFLMTYLIFHYYRRRHVYKKLSTRPQNIEQLLESTDESALGKAFDRTVSAHYALFIAQLDEAENVQTSHLTFIDRWVHQMKTPLSVIELTAQELDEPESSNVREETERMKQGLETVLYMARMRTIQQDFHVERVHVAQLLKEVQQENKRLYIRHNVFPHVEVENEYIAVETDEKWLFFILNQLIQNAVKYSAGKSNRVDLRIFMEEQGAVITVQDYGVGIPLHDQRRVFQPFYTGDNGRLFRESTGMGLYLVHEVVEYIGHQIEMKSTPNEGTSFTLRFSPEQTIVTH